MVVSVPRSLLRLHRIKGLAMTKLLHTSIVRYVVTADNVDYYRKNCIVPRI